MLGLRLQKLPLIIRLIIWLIYSLRRKVVFILKFILLKILLFNTHAHAIAVPARVVWLDVVPETNRRQRTPWLYSLDAELRLPLILINVLGLIKRHARLIWVLLHIFFHQFIINFLKNGFTFSLILFSLMAN